ncbi:MAG: hypothetical protein WBP64_14190 [Nitrososphaeraceae archaeon]
MGSNIDNATLLLFCKIIESLDKVVAIVQMQCGFCGDDTGPIEFCYNCNENKNTME